MGRTSIKQNKIIKLQQRIELLSGQIDELEADDRAIVRLEEAVKHKNEELNDAQR